MCVPMIAAAAASAASALAPYSTLLSVAGAGFGAISSYQQAQGQKDMARYNASVSAANAKVAEFKAQSAEDNALRDAEEVGRRQAAIRGKQRASFAANGLDLESGSPASVLEATDYYGLQDQATAVNNGGQQAWSLRTQRDGYQADAQMQSARARSISPFGAAAGSLLGSAAKLSSKWIDNTPTTTGSAWKFGVQ